VNIKMTEKRSFSHLPRSPTASSSIRFEITDSSSTRALAPKHPSRYREELDFGMSPAGPEGVEGLAGDRWFPPPVVCPPELAPLLPLPPGVGDVRLSELELLLPMPLLGLELPSGVHEQVAATHSSVSVS
jgi:hypothetical protein